jgi:rubrerythrin
MNICEPVKKYYQKQERMVDMALLGDPFVANVPKKLSLPELIQALRVDIAGELEAIIGYEAHIMATDDERVKKILTHIADEERHHVGELQQLLFILNPTEQQHFDKGLQAVQQQQSQNFQTPMQ